MKCEEKRFCSAFVLVTIAIGAVLVGMVAYFQLKAKPESQPQPTTTSQQTQTPQATSPTKKDDTANWKTYANTKYKYYFKYPGNLVISSDYGFGDSPEALMIPIEEFSGIILFDENL